MKKILLNSLTVVTLFFTTALNAQVGIGVPSENIHPSAELEVKSTTKGFLPPRMTKAERDAILAPAPGLLVFQTDGDASGLYYFDGKDWKNGLGVQGPQGEPGVAGPKGDAGTYSSPTYTIGLWPELGGYVFWVSEDGKHGLVAETQDQALSNWPNAQSRISNPSTHSIYGSKFRDWRLPTLFELKEIYAHKEEIGKFEPVSFWSSTESFTGMAYVVNFDNGNQIAIDKIYNGDYSVRAVRSF